MIIQVQINKSKLISNHKRGLNCWNVIELENTAAAAAAAAAAAKSPQSCPTLCDPIDSSPEQKCELSLACKWEGTWNALSLWTN